MKKRIGLLSIFLILLQSVIQAPLFAADNSNGSMDDAALYDYIMDKEAEFIAGCQLPGGAIAMQAKPMQEFSDGYRVMPYFSNLAAIGLLEEPSYAPAAKKYMDWYFGHINTPQTDYNNVDGTIYDYQISADGASENPERKYDSTDSYAATFFSLLRKYIEVTGDTQYAFDHLKQLDSIGGAMLSTFDRGLTYAKPDFRVQYMMDNVEVHKGLSDAAWIYGQVLKDADKSAYYSKYRQEVEDAIQNILWDEETKSYANYRNDSMLLTGSVLTNFYSDATAQLFPIWEEMLKPDEPRALQLYNTFCSNFPGWPEMKDAGDYPWALMVYTAAVMGDKTRVDTYLKTARERYIDKGHPLNWYNLEAGMTLLAASIMKSTVFEQVKLSVNSQTDGQTISSLPFRLYGDSSNAVKIEAKLVHDITKQEVNLPGLVSAQEDRLPL